MDNLSHTPEYIEALIVNFLEGTIKDKEVEALNRWISDNEDNLQLFNNIKSAWLLSGKKEKVDHLKVESALETIKKKAFNTPEETKSQFWNFSRIAASWLIILLVGGVLGKYLNPSKIEDNQSKITTISAPLGSRSEVKLPDGTKVWLNAGSCISYNGDFGKSHRKINLTGEAYFDVTKNEKAPFFIKTNKNITIKVLGTAFNVKAYPEENFVETTVERGKVQVSKFISQTKQMSSVTLLPKQKLKIEYSDQASESALTKAEEKLSNSNKDILQSNIETKVYTSWKDGEWIIDSEPLESIAVKIERSYNVNIEFKDTTLKKYVFTGILKDETLEQVLELIKLTAPIKYSIDKRTVELTKNKLIQ